MDRPDNRVRADRYLFLAGPAFAALLVLGAAAFPAPPGGDVSAASDPRWLATHVQAVIVQSYVRALAALAFLVLTASLVSAMRRVRPVGSPLPGAAMVGGALSGGLMLSAQATGLAAALYVDAGGRADVTRALGSLQAGLLDMSAVPAALLFGAAGLAGLRTAFLPRWLAVVCLAGVPFALVDAASYDGGPLEAVGLIGLAYFLGWSLVTGLRLFVADDVSGLESVLGGGAPVEA